MDHKICNFSCFRVCFLGVFSVLCGPWAVADAPPSPYEPGISGQPSAEEMKTELGAYKARLHQAVASYWYMDIASPMRMQMIGTGSVTVQYTIKADGIITAHVMDHQAGSVALLSTISVRSILKCSPFIPFSASLQQQIGNSYTDSFTFAVK
jgi:hypothetical protein